jgi:hypothetical protein
MLLRLASRLDAGMTVRPFYEEGWWVVTGSPRSRGDRIEVSLYAFDDETDRTEAMFFPDDLVEIEMSYPTARRAGALMFGPMYWLVCCVSACCVLASAEAAI